MNSRARILGECIPRWQRLSRKTANSRMSRASPQRFSVPRIWMQSPAENPERRQSQRHEAFLSLVPALWLYEVKYEVEQAVSGILENNIA